VPSSTSSTATGPDPATLGTLASGFAGLLRAAGVPAGTDQVARFVRAIALTTPATLDELYWVGRVTLVAELAHIEAYDRAFGQVFRGLHDWVDARGPEPPPPPPTTRRPPTRSPDRHNDGSGPDLDGDDTVEVAFASREERLATTDFADLTDEELRELRVLMRDLRITVPLRRARRHHRHRNGDRPDLRATLRRSRRTGGDPVERVTSRARQRPRRLVVLCDISGSMAPYARACLQLLHAAGRGVDAETFTFATRLTRLTRALAIRDADAALAAAASTAPDWKGGTRIGAALKDFVDTYGRRGMARGAVVVVVSDGWDRDDPALVAQQMDRLRRLAHRIVWVNPRTAASDYQPLAGGMAAALPHCDQVVSGHTLTALAEAFRA